MNSESQKLRKESNKRNLLEEYHNEKRSEDQLIQLRKILIWLFIFCCVYFVFVEHDGNEQEHKISVQQRQSQALNSQEIQLERSINGQEKTGSQTYQESNTQQNIVHNSNQQNHQEYEKDNQNRHQNGVASQERQVVQQGNHKHSDQMNSDDNTQYQQQDIPQEQI